MEVETPVIGVADKHPNQDFLILLYKTWEDHYPDMTLTEAVEKGIVDLEGAIMIATGKGLISEIERGDRKI